MKTENYTTLDVADSAATHGSDALRATDVKLRDQVKALAEEWCIHSSNGLDILADSCLDDIAALIQAMRP